MSTAMHQTLKTRNPEDLRTLLEQVPVPLAESHKGDNGKTLIIGGSELFHASVLWAAEIASHFVDMLHFASTKENNQIMQSLKKQFRNGIVIKQEDIPYYIEEDESVLVGPGMVRTKMELDLLPDLSLTDILQLEDEAHITAHLTKYVIHQFPNKQFIFDAGALQMMHPDWLITLQKKPILTPHQLEFRRLFGVAVKSLPMQRKIEVVEEHARRYGVVIMLKAVKDIITDGSTTYIVDGGNQGLTKGGTGDILAGLATAFAAKSDPLVSAVMASFVLKRAADELSEDMGYWYNISNLIDKIPRTLKQLYLP